MLNCFFERGICPFSPKYNSSLNYYYLGDICILYCSFTILTLTFLFFFFFSYIDIYYTKILIWSCLSYLYHLFVNMENQLKGKNKNFELCKLWKINLTGFEHCQAFKVSFYLKWKISISTLTWGRVLFKWRGLI